MPPIDHALIHRARVVSTVRDRTPGTRNAQGEYEPVADAEGPWFPARRATQRQTEETPEAGGGTRRRRTLGYVLIYGTEYEDGTPLVPPTASDVVEVQVYGVVERWQVTGTPEPFDSGYEVFGGQIGLVAVGDST